MPAKDVPIPVVQDYLLAYDDRLQDNRVHTFELEALPDAIKKAIKNHIRIHHNRAIHLSTSDDPEGVKYLAPDSETLVFFLGIKASKERRAQESEELMRQVEEETKSAETEAGKEHSKKKE